MLAGSALFAATQRLPVTTSWYWAITTATTVGYGDVTPHSGGGRVIASVVMLTAIPLLASVFALVTGQAAATGLRRIMAMSTRVPDGVFRLVVGTSPEVPEILRELTTSGLPAVLVADVDPATAGHGVCVVRGDPTSAETIRAARPQDAEQALVTGASDGDVVVSAVLLRKLAPDLTVTALVSSPAVREALGDLGIRQTISAHELVVGTLAQSLEAPHGGQFTLGIGSDPIHRVNWPLARPRNDDGGRCRDSTRCSEQPDKEHA